jgi:hypothetical protein
MQNPKNWQVILFLSVMLIGLSAMSYFIDAPPKPIWNGSAWTCPARYDVYADESAAIAGKSFVHCVK